MADGSLIFDTKIDQSGFEKGTASLKSAGTNLVRSLGVAFSAGAIAKGMVSLTKQSIGLASSLQEVQNVVDVTFGESADVINEFARGAGEAFGMAELQAKEFSGTMGSIFDSMGVSAEATLEMSQNLVRLSGDLASFRNASHEEAFEKIRAGIVGEIEPLRQWGIVVSVANLEAYALSKGIDKTYESMTQAEQAVLRYNYIMEHTAAAQGDFQRTQDSYANQLRTTSLAIQEIGASIGERLLPAATRTVSAIGHLATGFNDAFKDGGLREGLDYITEQFPVATAAVSGFVMAMGTLTVLKRGEKLTDGYRIAKRALVQWLEAGTAAEVVEAGVLAKKEILLGLMTKRLTAAQAAQALFNSTVKANPLGAAAAGIGALVAGIVLLVKHLKKTKPELFELGEIIKEINQASDDLATNMEESAQEFEQATADIERQAESANRLVDELFALSSAYSGTKDQQKQMEGIISSLNSQYDELNISYDKQTGKINKTEDAIRDLIEARKAEAIAAAQMKRYQQLIEEQLIAEENLRKAQAARSEAVGASVFQIAMLIEAENDAAEVYEEATENLEFYTEMVWGSSEAAEEAAASQADLAKVTEEAAEAFALSKEQMQPIKDQLEELADAYTDVYNSVYSSLSGQFDIWDKVGRRVKLSTEDILKNTSQQAEYFESYADNIEALSGRGIAGIDSLISKYSDGSAESVAAIAALASATDEELSEIAANLNEQEISFDRISSAIAEEETNFSETLGQIETEYNTLVESLNNGEAVDMSQFSEAVSTAFADLPGMMGGIGSQMAEALMEPLRTLGAEGEEGGIGTQIAHTIATGLTEDETLPTAGQTAVMSLFDAMSLSATTAGFSTVGTSICTEFVGAFSNLQSQMYSIGTNAVSGLIAGINAKKPDAVAAAKALASAVQAAFKVRLRIQSPSKVFYGFGENTVQGFTNAIKDSMQSVKSTMTDFSDMVAAPFATSRTLHETVRSAPAPVSGGNVNVTQNIYAEKQSPAQMLREARWQQERAVLVGV